MSDENQNTESTTTEAEPETYTLTRAQLDEFRARAVEEHAKSAPANPLDRYYQGTAARRAGEQPKQAAPSSASSELGELIALAKTQLAMSLAASAPKAPEPVKPMDVTQKLASKDVNIMLGRGPNGWTAQDSEQLRERHRRELARSGHPDVEGEAQRRVSGELRTAFGDLGHLLKVDVRR